MKRWMHLVKQFSLKGKLALFIILLITMVGLLEGLIAGYPHSVPSGSALEAPSSSHWLGTDDLGIDIFAQICHGARISLLIGASSALLAGLGGSVIGILAGYRGGWVDRLMMRIIDIFIILPDFVLVIVIASFFGPSLKNIIIVMALLSWVQPARMSRGKVLSMKEELYIKAAKSYGANFYHMLTVHFLPSLIPLLMFSIIQLVGRAIVTEAGLAFLGLGDPLSKSWGLILNHSMNFKGIYYTEFWKWWVMSPLIAIFALVVSLAFLSREWEQKVLKRVR